MLKEIKIEPYVHSVDFRKSNNPEIVCCLGDWSLTIEHGYKGDNIKLESSPKFNIREILNNPETTLEQLITDENSKQMLRYLEKQEKEEFNNLNNSLNRFKKDLQKINENDIKLFVECQKEFLKSIDRFHDGCYYLFNKHGEIEFSSSIGRNQIIDYIYRFPYLHYYKKITTFTFAGLFNNEEVVFIPTSPLLSLNEEKDFEDIRKKWYIFKNFTVNSRNIPHIPSNIITQKNNIDSYKIIIPEGIDKQSIIVTFDGSLITTKPILDELSKKDVIFEYYTVGENQKSKYYVVIKDIEKFSNNLFTLEDVVTNILNTRKVKSYHGFTSQNKDEWTKAMVEINKLLENKTKKEILFFKRNNDLNISLDLELSSPKIILTDFFKEKIGEYVFQLCMYPPTWDKNDIEPLNETIITEAIIKDIVEAFNVHNIELKALENVKSK